MILTLEFLQSVNACRAGVDFVQDNNLIDLDYDYVIEQLNLASQPEYANFLIDIKTTEAYVRANGEVITMGTTYQVYNPMTGQHQEYQDEESAREGIADIQRQILEQYPVSVTQSITNENGDSTWIPITISPL